MLCSEHHTAVAFVQAEHEHLGQATLLLRLLLLVLIVSVVSQAQDLAYDQGLVHS